VDESFSDGSLYNAPGGRQQQQDAAAPAVGPEASGLSEELGRVLGEAAGGGHHTRCGLPPAAGGLEQGYGPPRSLPADAQSFEADGAHVEEWETEEQQQAMAAPRMAATAAPAPPLRHLLAPAADCLWQEEEAADGPSMGEEAAGDEQLREEHLTGFAEVKESAAGGSSGRGTAVEVPHAAAAAQQAPGRQLEPAEGSHSSQTSLDSSGRGGNGSSGRPHQRVTGSAPSAGGSCGGGKQVRGSEARAGSYKGLAAAGGSSGGSSRDRAAAREGTPRSEHDASAREWQPLLAAAQDWQQQQARELSPGSGSDGSGGGGQRAGGAGTWTHVQQVSRSRSRSRSLSRSRSQSRSQLDSRDSYGGSGTGRQEGGSERMTGGEEEEDEDLLLPVYWTGVYSAWRGKGVRMCMCAAESSAVALLSLCMCTTHPCCARG
jgi:hypothetical protein